MVQNAVQAEPEFKFGEVEQVGLLNQAPVQTVQTKEQPEPLPVVGIVPLPTTNIATTTAVEDPAVTELVAAARSLRGASAWIVAWASFSLILSLMFILESSNMTVVVITLVWNGLWITCGYRGHISGTLKGDGESQGMDVDRSNVSSFRCFLIILTSIESFFRVMTTIIAAGILMGGFEVPASTVVGYLAGSCVWVLMVGHGINCSSKLIRLLSSAAPYQITAAAAIIAQAN